ncbi:MAG TPA: tyrosine-type recombinase/integrase [Roseiflexaceae bacterium]|nr:tyrosine-type recombinase/integrase [Roseiflexaceae bacterium]
MSADELRALMVYLDQEHVPHGNNSHRPAADRVGMSVNARDSIWRVLRALWNWLADEDRLAPSQLNFFRRDRVPRPRAAEADDDLAEDRQVADDALVAALLAACGEPVDELAARNRAIILLLYESGMRVSELCSLEDRQVQLGERQARIRGKGGKRRWVFWGDGAAAAIQRYLALRSGDLGGPLLRGASSRNPGGPMTSNAVRGMLRRLAEAAGVELPPHAPVHGFRAGYAQQMLDAGVDGLDLQQLLGHSDIRTTMIYVRRSPGRLREVYRRATRGDAEARRRRSGCG